MLSDIIQQILLLPIIKTELVRGWINTFLWVIPWIFLLLLLILLLYWVIVYSFNNSKAILLLLWFIKYYTKKYGKDSNYWKTTRKRSFLEELWWLPFFKKSKKIKAKKWKLQESLEKAWYNLVRIEDWSWLQKTKIAFWVKEWEWPTERDIENILYAKKLRAKEVIKKVKISIREPLKHMLIGLFMVIFSAVFANIAFWFFEKIYPTWWSSCSIEETSQRIIKSWWQRIIDQYQRVIAHQDILMYFLAFVGIYMLIFFILSGFIRMISFGNKWFLFVSRLLFWIGIIIIFIGFCINLILTTGC